jgi:hypothetical protein
MGKFLEVHYLITNFDIDLKSILLIYNILFQLSTKVHELVYHPDMISIFYTKTDKSGLTYQN